ncbi:hypothetical protein ANRL4_03413 [Anaerolineae bacterium]|nr:hypothetical protein ANRL4_03413 [Anaerolineae bacterium]
MLRGGSWNNNNTENFRCDYRNRNNPENRNNNRGFRLALPCPLKMRMPGVYGRPVSILGKSAGGSRPSRRKAQGKYKKAPSVLVTREGESSGGALAHRPIFTPKRHAPTPINPHGSPAHAQCTVTSAA